MNDKDNETRAVSGRDGAVSPGGTRPVAQMKCDDIQDLLTEYMTRELGDAQSALVREHIRLCPNCQKAAVAMQALFDLLRASGQPDPQLPVRLSDRRRARIQRAWKHPLIGWIEIHHWIVSLLAATLLIAAVCGGLYFVSFLKIQPPVFEIPVDMLPEADGTLDSIPAIEDTPAVVFLTPLPELEPDFLGDTASQRGTSAASNQAQANPRDATPGQERPQTVLLPQPRGGQVMLAALLILLIAGGAVFRRRDATEDDGKAKDGPPPV